MDARRLTPLVEYDFRLQARSTLVHCNVSDPVIRTQTHIPGCSQRIPTALHIRAASREYRDVKTLSVSRLVSNGPSSGSDPFGPKSRPLFIHAIIWRVPGTGRSSAPKRRCPIQKSQRLEGLGIVCHHLYIPAHLTQKGHNGRQIRNAMIHMIPEIPEVGPNCNATRTYIRTS